MSDRRFRRRIAGIFSRIQRPVRVAGALLILALAVSEAYAAQCTEKPTVWLTEEMAASHLLASRKFVFPAVVPALGHIRSVVVMVTVSRKGKICKAKAKTGPPDLRDAAERVVKTSWRYRPFLLDGKPVVAQFPVTVNFLLSADKKDVKSLEVTEVLPLDSIPFLWTGPRASTP